jgi:hypothetical protein
MSRKVIARCDRCGAEAEATEQRFLEGCQARYFPKGWTVLVAPHFMASEPYKEMEFCAKCGGSFLEWMKDHPVVTFEQAWAVKEVAGFQYGPEALEQVRMGWDMAMVWLAGGPSV